jgi:hypothetical protein
LKSLRIREEARAELLRETAYYEGRLAGTGKRFREAVAASFDLIRRFPAGGAPGPPKFDTSSTPGDCAASHLPLGRLADQ